MKYRVDIVETYKRTVEINAEDEDEAYEVVDEMINEGKIDLPCDGGGYEYERDLFVRKDKEIELKQNRKTIEEKVDWLNQKLGDIFSIDCSSKCIDFYYKYISEGLALADVDKYAMLNTLFGYDIGKENALKLCEILWENIIEIVELGIDDNSKQHVIDACNELGLELDFSKWRTEDIVDYEYY